MHGNLHTVCYQFSLFKLSSAVDEDVLTGSLYLSSLQIPKRKCRIVALQEVCNTDTAACYVAFCVPLLGYNTTYLWYAEQSQQIGHLYRRHWRGSTHYPRNDLSHLRLVAMIFGVVNVANGTCKESKSERANQCQVPNSIYFLLSFIINSYFKVINFTVCKQMYLFNAFKWRLLSAFIFAFRIFSSPSCLITHFSY